MKKIYSFIALMLLLFVGNAQAQTSWDVDDQNGSVATIEEGKKYAFHCGFNPGYGNNGYMHTAGGAMNVPSTFTSAYIFEFIKVSEKEANGETFPVYILKNLGNGQYYKGSEYTSKKSEAFRFTARKATAMTFAGGASEDWYEYSTQVIDQEELDEGQNDRQNCRGAVEAGCWVFCSPDEDAAIAYIGNGGNSGYHDTRDWLIYEATEHQMTAYERLGYYYEMYCQNEVNEENYPIGTNPGYLDSQEYYNTLKAAYDAAVAAYANTGLSDDEYNRVTDALVKAFEGLNEHLVQVGAGYYMFIAQRSQDALRDSGSVTYAREWTAPESWTLANANVIWQVIPSGEEGKFYVKNFVTGKYLGAGPGTSAQFPLATDTVAKYTFEQVQGKLFVINQNGKLMHCDGGYKAVTWNDRAASGNQHIINKVDQSILDSLQGKVDSLQNAAKWAALVKEGQNILAASEFQTDCSFDGNFAAEGLVSEAFDNHGETSEGPLTNLFDKDLNSFYHTSWSADFEDGLNDWIDLDLGKEVQHFFIKIARRPNTSFNCAPLDFKLSAPEPGLQEFTEHNIAWDKVLIDSATLSWDYSYTLSGAEKAAHVAIYKVDLEEPVQYIRFEVLNTVASKDTTIQRRASGTPWWNASEFRVYENLGPDQFATFIPEKVKNDLVNAIAAAEAELAAGQFNEATYTALEEAIEAYNEAYPNPDALAWALEQAHAYAGTAVEGDDLGYFETGAADALETALAAVEAEVLAPESTEEEIKVKPMSAADLKKYEEQVRDAVNAFFDKLHKPEAGKYYQITSGSDNENINGAYVYAANADVEETAYWGYVGDGDVDYRANTMWEVVDAGEGKFALKNVATGRYIYNPYLHAEEDDVPEATQINFSTTPEALTFSYAKVEGMFNLEFADGHYFNTDPAGNIATWYDVDDINARFQFTEVEAPGQYTFDVQPNRLQVVSLPVDVAGVMVGELNAMKVLGQKDGMLQLQPYDDGEVIPAGTPFIVETAAEEASAASFPEWSSDFATIEYSYESKEQNGLWAAVLGKTLPANIGIFSEHKIVLSDEEEYVAPGTGYVVAEVPTTEETGTHAVALPEGLANGIHNAVIVRNNQAVYTINGVKVANTVSDLKNLPKGVYIIGGKKVVK
ncbi:MAG: hypothetical protein PUH44_02460 [Bacteroidales bacterium]|nr:hypothetical protein [Bacteroidales bacterium]MDY2705950.1 hypothetical protein [Alloprevotella sp.]